MSSALAGWLQLGLLVLALAVCYKPVGDYMAHIFGGSGPSGSGVSPGGHYAPRQHRALDEEGCHHQAGPLLRRARA